MFKSCIKIIILAAIVTCCCTRSEEEYVTVYVDSDEFKGAVKGLQKRNINDETFSAFLGIPYAKAPIGELRFKDPQYLDPINGSFDAFYQGHECCSITALNASEDCLNLNIFTKKIKPSQPLPVLVVIHPGGLCLGSSQWLDPSYMMTNDIVLVTFNYRLGTLGFLNLDSAEYPANVGLKDQVFALRWIKQHVAAFGGNPQDVTLMGYSAGALSASVHLVSPMSRGLFHKAIIMSGAVPPQTILPKGDQKYLAVRQAKRLNCTKLRAVEEANWRNGYHGTEYKNVKDVDILECLQQFSGQDIARTLRKMFDFGKDNPIYLWLPVVEKDYGQERFLTQDYYRALKDVDHISIPLLIGYTNGEFCTSAGDILRDNSLKLKLESNFQELAPRIFMYESQAKADNITERLSNFYFKGNTTLTLRDYDILCDLFSDSLIHIGAHRLADIVSKKGLVYFYEFGYQGKPKQLDTIFPNKKDRVEHMDDLQYLFNWSHKQNVAGHELNVVALYTDFMYDFIKNGKLTNPKAETYPRKFAVINEDIQYFPGRSFKNLRFWSELLPDGI